MADRNLLPKHYLEEFGAWLVRRGFAIREGRGHHQVAQIREPRGKVWHVIYERETGNPHYTVPEPLIYIAKQFIEEKRNAYQNSTSGQQARPEQEDGEEGSGPPW